jgi:hypothetical protein
MDDGPSPQQVAGLQTPWLPHRREVLDLHLAYGDSSRSPIPARSVPFSQSRVQCGCHLTVCPITSPCGATPSSDAVAVASSCPALEVKSSIARSKRPIYTPHHPPRRPKRHAPNKRFDKSSHLQSSDQYDPRITYPPHRTPHPHQSPRHIPFPPLQSPIPDPQSLSTLSFSPLDPLTIKLGYFVL